MTRDEARKAAVDAAAEFAWDLFRRAQTHSEDWPTWGELLAQGHQGLGRVLEFRGYAAASITTYERAMADAGWRMVRDCGEMPDPVDDGAVTANEWLDKLAHQEGWNACRAAMPGEE